MCCPALQALSVLDRSKSANLCSNMTVILKLSSTSGFHKHNIQKDYFTVAEFTDYCLTYCQKNVNDKLQNIAEEIAIYFAEYTQGQNAPFGKLGGQPHGKI
jgi:hypothetical protein